jgi:SAM-dependent methyltransferase
MASVSSYDPARTTSGALPGELARLEAQAALTFTEELQLLRELGLGETALADPGQETVRTGQDPAGRGRRAAGSDRHAAGSDRCAAGSDRRAAGSDQRWPLVEVGAGTGALTRRLAAALPGATVIALDADAGLLGYLPRSAASPPVCGDARALPLATGAASAVIFRYVLQHVNDPLRVLREARRVLRPGGSVFVIDVDGGLWGLVEPVDPGLASVYARAGAAQGDAGGDRLIGRKLSGLLRSAGFADVTVRPFAVTSDHRRIDDFEPHLGPGRLVPVVESGTLSLADLALATAAWTRLRADPHAWVMLVGLVAAGTVLA